MSGDDRLNQLRAVAGDVSRETFDALGAFQARFLQWNARINLVAASTEPEVWTRHILDSAQIVGLAGGRVRFLDLGSGGGFPGLVIALLLRGKDGAMVEMVESNRKKAAFLGDTIARFALPAKVYPCRIAEAAGRTSQPQAVTARALAALPDLLALAAPWLAVPGTIGLFHKGRDHAREFTEGRAEWDFDLVEHPSVSGGGGVVLEIANLRGNRLAGRPGSVPAPAMP